RPPPAEPTETRSIGHACPQGHRNVVGAVYCSTCGMLLATNGQMPAPATRSLGTLTLDDGTTFPLDASYVIGREPTEAGTVQAGSARPLAIDDADRVISRVHAEIRIVGRSVHIVDRDSANGTYIYPDGGAGWERLPPNEPHELTPGSQVLVGRRSLLYRPE
ncbi:MAG: FHA domain-containing protein, partial [Actinomycetota bacterium]